MRRTDAGQKRMCFVPRFFARQTAFLRRRIDYNAVVVRVSVALTIVVIFARSLSLWADPPSTRPTIPALTAGAAEPKSFVVDGRFRLSPEGGVAFRFASDEKRQLCVLFDPADGTPIF